MEVIIFESKAYQHLLGTLEAIQTGLTQQQKAAHVPIYNNTDLCSMLRVSRRTLQTWRDEGRIGFSQINNVILYSHHDVEDFLRKHHQVSFKFKTN